MGAWGSGSFENDTALDWLFELEESDDDAAIRSALDHAATLPETAELDSDYASCALAAAEVVAAARGIALDDLPDEVTAWVEERRDVVGEDLVALALQAVMRVQTNSELLELWQEAGDSEWADSVAGLQSRLASAGV